MFFARGYRTIEEIFESDYTLIVRAIRESDDLPVILKVLKNVRPSPELVARFKREYEIVKGLNIPGVVRAYDFFRAESHWLFVQEDFGGESFARLGLAGKISLDEFLAIAISLAGHLAAVHQQGITHKDLTPANVVFDSRTGTIKIIDFGIATRLARETIGFDHVSLIEGTPAYLSPEQTGRGSQTLDHRTDLYSLGCTCYELLTGRPPFEARDLIEMFHCHLTRSPELAHIRRPDVPRTISGIIDKLMAKDATDRYQTALGLQADLARCRQEWQAYRSIGDFPLAGKDVAHRLSPPGRRYGRDRQTAELMAGFARVAAGSSELMLVSGPAGIGKSALVKDLYRPITGHRGFFVSGKFDQLQRDTPYGAVLSALDGLVGQILMEPSERIATWAHELRRSTGGMLPALVGILPRLAILYDRLPPPLVLPPAEHNARFFRALASFVRGFASVEHPLVLFIDDLQWADPASLELLEHLMTAETTPYMLIIGAYRDEEAPASHPLRATLRDIHAANVEVIQLALNPLSNDDTVCLLADTFHREPGEVIDLAHLIYRKTGGNPFFIQTLLDTLVTEGAVAFDHEKARWTWQSDSVRLWDLSDNLVDLLIGNLRKLRPEARALLTQAACIGNRFELGLLAAITGRTLTEVASALSPALADGYLIPVTAEYRLLEAGLEAVNANLNVSYKFGHDRIQQAAYRLGAIGTHAGLHLQIGRGLRSYAAGRSSDPPILAIANQLNQASGLIDDVSERLELAALNLDSGRRSKAAAANDAARKYFEYGLACLAKVPADACIEGSTEGHLAINVHDLAFQQDHAIALALTEEVAEVAYLLADFAAVNQHADALLRHTRQLVERVKVIQIRVNAQLAEYRFSESIGIVLDNLPALGIDLPNDPSEADIETLFAAVALEMKGRSPKDLADLSEMIDPTSVAAMRLLGSIFAPSVLARPRLSCMVAAQMVLLSLRNGLAEETVDGFTYYGMSLCGRGQLALGDEFGTLAELLTERQQRESHIPNMIVLSWFYIFHWRRPVHLAVEKMRYAYRVGLTSGALLPGSNSLQGSSCMAFIAGRPLGEIHADYPESARALEGHKHRPFLNWLRQLNQAVRNLLGHSEDPTRLCGELYDEVAETPVHEQNMDFTSIYFVGFLKVILCYHFHDYEGSLRSARAREGGNQPGAVLLPIVYLYQGMSLLALHDRAPAGERPAMLEEARRLVEQMRGWGEVCPANYAHKYHLMAAELARVIGQVSEARAHYDRAIDLARAHEYMQEEALAMERAALFYLEQRNPRLAGHYMRDAYHAYGAWGSKAKQDFLRLRYGYLLERAQGTRAQAARADLRMVAATTSELGGLDLSTVLSATRAIARETAIDALLETVMRVSLENAGAERGFLILVRDDRLLVKVRSELGQERRFESISVVLGDQSGLAHSVVQYVARTVEPVLLDHAAEHGMFVNDPHIRATGCKSLLCVPVLLHGSLIAISYLENNRVAAMFNADRVDVLTLLTGQAAVSIESALLKEADEIRDFHFRVGGSLPADALAYVRRKADDLLVASAQRGELCYVFNTRQMGKSSLRIRAADRLGKAGVTCVSIDITSIGSSGITAEQWYAGIARMLVTGMGSMKDFDLRRWWRDKPELSPVHRLDVLVHEVLLEQIKTPIAVFIDEVDAVLGLDFAADDLFSLIRLFYNRRAEDPRYQRLCFVLLGVATPSDLIRDRRRTPFNIGEAISLTGFRFDEARTLIPGLARLGDGERLLRAVLGWSGGQPFLTQRLCRLLSEDESRPPSGREREWVASLVQSRVIDNWRHRDEPEHLKTIEARLRSKAADIPALLALYRRILNEVEVDAKDSPLEDVLVLSGLVTRTFDKLRVSNPIYAAIFDNRWIDEGLEHSALEPQRWRDHLDHRESGDRAPEVHAVHPVMPGSA